MRLMMLPLSCNVMKNNNLIEIYDFVLCLKGISKKTVDRAVR